jgi:hypothetical protein
LLFVPERYVVLEELENEGCFGVLAFIQSIQDIHGFLERLVSQVNGLLLLADDFV